MFVTSPHKSLQGLTGLQAKQTNNQTTRTDRSERLLCLSTSLVPLLLCHPELHTLPCNELNQIVITLLSGIHPPEGVLKVSTTAAAAASTEHGAGKAAAGENPENPASCGDTDVFAFISRCDSTETMLLFIHPFGGSESD